MTSQNSPIPSSRQPKHAEIEAALDEACRRDFAAFVQRFFPLLNGGKELMPNWHIDALAYWLEEVSDGRSTRLLVNEPPRHLKSEMVSILWVAFVLGHTPSKRVIVISHGNELAVALGNAFRTIVNSLEYKKLFPHMRISRTKNTEYEVATTAGGFRLAGSIDAVPMGRGADIIIIDDPLKSSDASSRSKRQRVIEVYRESIVTRLDEKRNGAIIIVMQRLHIEDLCGHVLQGPDQWDTLILPAISPCDVEVKIGAQRSYQRQEGEVLHPERESLEDIERQRLRMGYDSWAAQYQQQPIPPGGVLIKRDKIKRYEHPPIPSQESYIIQSWDTAIRTDENNSYSACITLLVHQGNYYVLHVFRERAEFYELEAKAEELARMYKPDHIVIEDGAYGEALVFKMKKLGYAATTYRPQGNKVARMSIQATKIEAGQLWLPKQAPWLGEFEAELFLFPKCAAR
jgi:predicted phage terminase large subunit-like protein